MNLLKAVRDGSVSTVGPWKLTHIVAVFDGTQIKSATGNRGTFEGRSPNILYQSAAGERTAVVSWEATPGATAGVLPGIHRASMAQAIEYLHAIRAALTDAQGRDKILARLGLLDAVGMEGFSGWQGKVAVGVQHAVTLPTEGGLVRARERALVNLAADIRGLVLAQEAVAWHFPIYSGAEYAQNGIEITVGRALTEAETADLYASLIKHLGHDFSPPIPTATGFRVLNFPDEKFALAGETDPGRIKELQEILLEKNAAFRVAVTDATAEQAFAEERTAVRFFETDGELRENNWSNGDVDYRARIEEAIRQGSLGESQSGGPGRPDLQRWIDDDLRPAIQAVNAEFARRYGWDRPQGAAEAVTGPTVLYHKGSKQPDGSAPAPRGTFNPDTLTVTLLNGADLSTALHEGAHFFFENDIALVADSNR